MMRTQIVEEERKKARKAVREYAEETSEGISSGGIDVDLMVREGVETLCREYLQVCSAV